MFISEDEARRRLEDERNIFSPSYVPSQKPKQDQVDGSPIRIDKDRDSPTQSHDDAPQVMRTDDIDRLLAGAVDPYKVRQRQGNLRGEIETQVAIGTVSHLIGSTRTGPIYDLSTSQVDAYQDGYSGSNDEKNRIQRVPERSRRLKSVKEQLAEKASSRLSAALDSLTDEKIEDCNAMRASAIAKDMSVVLDKVTKDHSKPESVHFHIFRPEMKTVSEYTTVHVSSPLIIPNDGGASS